MRIDPDRHYDLIGDVHGCYDALVNLLTLMGYRKQQGSWRHPSRVAVFLGDLIDRGPAIREVLCLVREMVEAGQAYCVMGNHEYNLLGWSTSLPDAAQEYVLPHNARYSHTLQETLRQFAHYPQDKQAFLEWFYQLPLFIDARRFRVVHACWDQSLINTFSLLSETACLTPELLKESAFFGSLAFKVCNRLLRGIQFSLDNHSLVCLDGSIRRSFRALFWANEPQTYQDVIFQPDPLPYEVALTALSKKQKTLCSSYQLSDPLLFIGHYWRSGIPEPIQANIACLDYSAVKGGKLVAYRLADESVLDPTHFVWVDAAQH